MNTKRSSMMLAGAVVLVLSVFLLSFATTKIAPEHERIVRLKVPTCE